MAHLNQLIAVFFCGIVCVCVVERVATIAVVEESKNACNEKTVKEHSSFSTYCGIVTP